MQTFYKTWNFYFLAAVRDLQNIRKYDANSTVFTIYFEIFQRKVKVISDCGYSESAFLNEITGGKRFQSRFHFIICGFEGLRIRVFFVITNGSLGCYSFHEKASSFFNYIEEWLARVKRKILHPLSKTEQSPALSSSFTHYCLFNIYPLKRKPGIKMYYHNNYTQVF